MRFAGGRTLPVTSLDRLVYPQDGITKAALMRHYVRAAPWVVPVVAGRALVLTRHPHGVGGPAFHQHDPGASPPDAVDVATLPTADGSPARRMVGSLAALLHAVQLGAVGVDAWHARAESPDAPDYAVLDLDPGPDARLPDLVAIAHAARELLRPMGRDAVLKTSGSRGVHLLVPLAPDTDFDYAAALAEEVATTLARALPGVATVERSIDERPPGSVYVDHLQNARGKTLAAAFCARARPGAPVSAPLHWDDLTPDIDLHRDTIGASDRRIAALGAVWTAEWSRVSPPGAWRPAAPHAADPHP